jgi:hypothetical protein
VEVVDVLFLIAFVGAAIVALVLWKAMNSARAGIAEAPPQRQATGPVRRRVAGPDDDPEFLRQLSEQVRRPEDPQA